jgi:hypothetical protein
VFRRCLEPWLFQHGDIFFRVVRLLPAINGRAKLGAPSLIVDGEIGLLSFDRLIGQSVNCENHKILTGQTCTKNKRQYRHNTILPRNNI